MAGTTLTYGLVRPNDGDRGATFWDELAGNITKLDAHDHDGTDSPRLTTAASTAMTSSVSAASWGATIGNGQYRQLITLPAALSYDSVQITFRETTNNETVFTKHIKASASTYYVYTNDNTLALTAVYTS
jgi:hypothetical protein